MKEKNEKRKRPENKKKMFRYVICLVFLLPAVTLSQFITLRDGKIGVNFGGYHAEAGLGGLLTGNAAHGGLSASAGTPFGQRAGAGIGGTVLDGQTKGGAYAGASAGYGVGASAALGGNVDGVGASGGLGSEAHAGGVSKKTVKLSQTPQHPHQQDTVNEVYGGDRSLDARFDDDDELDVPQTPAPQPKISRGRKPHPRINKYASSRFDNQAPPSNQPTNNFDYTKFFDFGFFSNLGATYSGAPLPSQQNGRVISYTKQIDPNTVVFHKTVY